MNRYPLWKYIIVAIALVMGFVYTLPNFFGESPAVQVSSAKATIKVDQKTLTRVEEALKGASIVHDGIQLDFNGVKTRLRDTDTQLKAKDILEKAFNPDPADPQYVVALNLLSALTVAQEAHRVMTAPGTAGGATGGVIGGVIVNISSVSGHRPSPGTASYGAAKAGIDSLTGSLAVEWAPAVRVNSVVVGPVKTELAELHYGDADGVAAVDATIPMGRMADPRDVGLAAAFLASPLAAYITGAELLVHGGGEKPAFLSASTAQNAH